jgi:predicted metalloprotease with PDZ domain
MNFVTPHLAPLRSSPARILILSLLAAAVPIVAAQEAPAPRDQPYPGIIELQVDATNVGQKIFKVHERIPVKAGKVTLLFPKWRLGAHAPAGMALSQFAGLVLTGNRQRLQWKRDPLDVYAFQANVPAGVAAVDADFEFLSPVERSQGAILATPDMLAIHWEALLLYPAGFYAHGIIFRPSVILPPDWKFGGALEAAGPSGAEARFKPVNLEELIDSPIYAGKYFKRVDLDPGAKVPVFLDMVADNPSNLEGTPQQIQAHRSLVQQAYKLFGSHHYDHYDFLMAVSDEFSFAGLEHHQSGENGVRSTYFSDWDKQQSWRSNLVSHEYIHSWDGKFRRPADQLTANFNMPLQDSLLWVYEGATSYWGHVIGARSGLVEESQMRDGLAATAALYDHRIGRSWRSLQDTTNEPIITQRRPLGWVSWQRTEDYYSEGELIWLDVDTKIRELSGDRRSLDDFARSFFGVQDGRHEPLGYTFKDVADALNAVQAFDWASFLRARLDGHGPGAPLDGVARSGWKLVYTEQPSNFYKDEEAYRKVTDFSYSLGFGVDSDGRLVNLVWDSPAFKAGLTGGYTLLAVNGRAFKAELLKAAITAAKSGSEPMELLLKKDDRYVTCRIDYHDGLKYPHLVRIEGTPDRLAAIFQPLE